VSTADAAVAVTPDAAAVVEEIVPEELNRLLGMPRARPLEGELLARAAGAKEWYATHGRPRIVARRATIAALEPTRVVLGDGRALDGRALAERLAGGRAHAALAVAVTAGPEIDAETDRLWRSDLPDEAFFLDRVGTAVVERLMLTATLRLCRDAAASGETALPHLSPGCGAWELDAQRRLFAWLAGDERATALPPFEMLESSMLRPKLSLLAVVGLTRDGAAVSAVGACRACDLSPCVFRRAPYARAAA
jgi:hypothetical protein